MKSTATPDGSQQTVGTCLEAALAYAERGLAVFPVYEPDPTSPSGCACRKPSCARPAKHPRTVNGHKDATTSPATIAGWWTEWPAASIGVSCSAAPSGQPLVVIDADQAEALAAAEAAHGELPDTFTVTTGRTGGRHYYYSAPAGFEPTTSRGQLPKGIDVRGGNAGYVIAPPSRHASGVAYTVERDAPIRELPVRWVEAIRKPAYTPPVSAPARATGETTAYGRRALDGECEQVAAASEGTRRDTLRDAACRIGSLIASGQISADGAPERLAEAARTCGLGEPELGKTITDGLEKGMGSPRPAPPRTRTAATTPLPKPGPLVAYEPPAFSAKERSRDEVGNARRLVDLYGDVIRYVPEWSSWIVWSGKRWERDATQRVELFAKLMSDSLLQEAAAAVSIGKDGEPLAKHYQRSRSDRALRGAIHQAQSEPGICVPAAKLDAHPHLLNAANGTLNLETGQLQPHDPADLLTMSAACSYEPGAECPTFDAFLLRNLAGDLDLIGLLQRLAGVALLGRVEAHVLPILYGNGSNGKSRFVEAILHALGDYGMKGSTDLLIQGRRSPGAASPEVADLRGRRLVVVGETGERVSMNLARMKDLTGGDTLTARNLYEAPFEFQPSHTLFFHTNHLPRLGDSTEAIRRRICKIEWPVQIPEAERDEQLPAKLEAEAEGILRWMVGGVRQYRAGGLRPPLSVQVASNEYVTSEDGILTFLGEECDQDEALRVLSKPLYEAYKRWAIDNGEEPLTNKAFSLRLERDGYEKRKTKRGAEWLGIDLRGPSEPSDSMVTGDGCDGFSPKFSSRARAVDFVQAPVTRHPNDGKTAPGAKSGEHNPSPAEPNPAPRTPREGPQPVVSGGERLLSDYLAEDDGSAA